jgi:RES domain-containing protein
VILWRVSNYRTLDGIGGLLASGRWHSRGRPVVYCTWNPATALLETLVHMEIDSEDHPAQFQVLKIEGPDSLSMEKVDTIKLPRNWKEETYRTQVIGDSWLAEGRSLLLDIPCVLVPETSNVLVNPAHSEARLLKIAAIYEHPFDPRLF